MITRNPLHYAFFGSLLLIGSAVSAGEEDIALADVPAAALAAAKDAVDGIQITEAEVEVEDGVTVYEFQGTADGAEYEIEVTAEGKVLEVEQDD